MTALDLTSPPSPDASRPLATPGWTRSTDASPRPADPRWARPARWILLALTAGAYLWNLTASGWANSFYSAAVQAGSKSWEAFFYGSLDAGNSITVDKPPASLWVMGASVRLFGLNSFAILLPEVLMGVAAVAVLHATVKRHFGAVAGLVAGLTLALTPVAVLMFRFNNPDALLTLLMTLGAWATVRAVDRGSVRWMALVGVFIGLGFLTKTLQVMLVVPGFGLAFLLFARTTLRRRLLGSLAAVGATIAAAGWWVAVVELVPASSRPYIGGSQDNSFWNLTFGYNGFGRLSGNETGSVGGGGGWGATGLGRMFSDSVGGQISWLLPAALILLVAGVALRGRALRTDAHRAAYMVWGGWLVVTALTFSFMAGIFHEYYTVALAPAIAAVVGMGAAEAWERRQAWSGRLVLAAATAVTGVWSFWLLSRTTAYGDWLRVGVLALGLAAAAGFVGLHLLHRRAVSFVAAAALVAGLAGPAAYSWTTVNSGHTGSIVTAGPSTGGFGGGRGGGAPGGFRGTPPTGTTPGGTVPGGTGSTGAVPGGTGSTGAPPVGGSMGSPMGGLLDASTPSAAVVTALETDSSAYTWVAATVGSQNAAGLQLATQLPVMAIGGFNGSDPSPTLAQFEAYVKAGRIHYFVAGMGGGAGGMGGSGSSSQITAWVEAHYKTVTIGGETFYDLTQPVSAS